MRHLFLLRHATTEGNATGGDAQRQLTPIGEAEARAVGALLAQLQPRPQRILCSTARRVRQTLAGVLEGASGALGDMHVQEDSDLYLASPDRIMDCVAALPDDVQSVLVIAHNPGLSDLAQHLVGSAEPEAITALGFGFRPATLMQLRFEAAPRWTDVRAARGHLVRMSHAGN